MFTIHSRAKRLLLALAASTSMLVVVGCSGQGNQAATAADVNAFNGGGAQIPADVKAKMQAAQQNGQATQQQAAQAARQKAAQQPAKP